MNLVAITSACAVECERQQVGLPEVGYLINAYDTMFDIRDAPEYQFSIHTIMSLGMMVEPYKNHSGYRGTPVTFNLGVQGAAPHGEVVRMMENFCIELSEYIRGRSLVEDTDVFVKQFLWIHPFRDGNGRVAFLLQNFLDKTLDNPQPLRKHF